MSVKTPGNSMVILNYVATPFFLDSFWALIPVVILVVLLIFRTQLEDKTLQDELEGYREYAGRTRYRLCPGIW